MTEHNLAIEKSIQRVSGITTIKLHNTFFNPKIETFASLVDLLPLLQARASYFKASAEQQTALLQLEQAQRDLLLAQNLQHENALSTRKLREQKNLLDIAKVNAQATQYQSATLRLQSEAQWGKTLSHWFLSDQDPHFLDLSQGHQQLYLLYLPKQLATPPTTVALQTANQNESEQSAKLISYAPIYGINQQAGTPYFYLTDSAFNGHHQRVKAQIPMQKANLSGVIIPASALVWHLGQPFVYTKIDDQHFKRIQIDQKKLINSGNYFIQQALQQDDILVISGAQMLLSEEFRGQIPAEDNDDD
ncbi:MAG: hypothetical protein RQ733_04695 [Methyloprofundus sp.]|nr:hypothetical protein [Methyloprofundus sp.]MDT8425253.1 hypothetical protein [Methyloprofundus sp.]